MNVLFLIGNGFDLNSGLETRFKDVLKTYITVDSNDITISSFKNDIDRNIKNWSDFEKQIGIYTDKFSHGNDANIEFLEYSKCIYDFQKHLREHLKKEEERAFYNEKEIASVFKESVFNFSKYLNNEPKMVIDHLLDDLVKYNFISFNYTVVFDKCIEIFKSDPTLPKTKKTGGSTVTYANNNYIGPVFHIHGTLDSDMILGVDNINQISNIAFRKLDRINSIIKPSTNDSLENLKNMNLRELISNAGIYIIFGMSIGATDKTWWNEIAQQIINSNYKRLIIFTRDENSDFSFPFDKIEHKNYWKDLFLKQIDFDDDKKSAMERRISIVINKNIFNIKVAI